MESFCSEDRNRLTWKAWGVLLKKCGCFEGEDPDHKGYNLCSDKKNTGTVPQAKGFRRCNIFCCSQARMVEKHVNATLAKRAKELKKERVESGIEEQLQLSLRTNKGKVVDLTGFVSQDSLKYA
jgi:hypothetical protein